MNETDLQLIGHICLIQGTDKGGKTQTQKTLRGTEED